MNPYTAPLDPETVHGDLWMARLRREHERHAGIPDYGWCPGRDGRNRPVVRMVTSAMLARQREHFARSAK